MKDRMRCQVQRLSFRKTTKQMVRRLLELLNQNINKFLLDKTACKNVSPLSFVANAGIVDYCDLKLDYGACVEVFEDNRVTSNINNLRSTLVTFMGYASYSNPSMRFAFLAIGKRAQMNQWVELPIPK